MTAMESTETWQQAITAQIGRGIDRARGKRSDQWIADRVTSLGYPMSRTAVSEFRRGVRKTISVADLLAIAAALEVPPVALLFPGLPDGEVAVLPRSSGRALDALRWFSGEVSRPPYGWDMLVDAEDFEDLGCVLKAEYKTEPMPAEGSDGALFRLVQLTRELAGNYQRSSERLQELLEKLTSGQPADSAPGLWDQLSGVAEGIEKQRRHLEEGIRALGGVIEDDGPILHGGSATDA